MPISGHKQIRSGIGGGWNDGRRLTELQLKARFGQQGLEQHGHQRPMLQDPAHCGGSPGCDPMGRRQIPLREHDLAVQGAVAEVEPTEWRQGWLQREPEIKLLEQLSAGMGEGVGALALAELLRRERIPQLHLPAGTGQGQGRQRTAGPGAVYPGPQGRRRLGRWQGHGQQRQKNRSTSLCCGDGKR